MTLQVTLDYRSRLRKLKVQTHEASEPLEIQVDDGDTVASLLPKICKEMGVARNVDEYGLLLGRESLDPSAQWEASDSAFSGDRRATLKSSKKRSSERSAVGALGASSAGMATDARSATLRAKKRSAAVDSAGGSKGGINALFGKLESRDQRKMEKLKRKLKTDDRAPASADPLLFLFLSLSSSLVSVLRVLLLQIYT